MNYLIQLSLTRHSCITRLLIICGFILLFSCNKDHYADPQPPVSQATWVIAANLQVPVALNSLYFLDSLKGFAVGDSGLVVRTQDGGSTWNVNYLFPGYQLYRIKFTSPSTGWICGSNGLLKYTLDGGNTWTSKTLGTSATLRDFFFSGNHGWVVGSLESDTTAAVWHTIDGGSNWIHQHSHTHEILQGVFFRDSLGWAVGTHGTIIKSIDGGGHWDALSSGLQKNLEQVYFSNDLQGFTIGEEGTYLKTIDGGSNWNIASSSTFSNLYDIFFLDNSNGWIAGEKGKILRTADAGNTWTPENSGTQSNLYEIQLVSPLRGFAVGATASSHGFILIYK